MPFSRTAQLDVVPVTPGMKVPYATLLLGLLRNQFETTSCYEMLSRWAEESNTHDGYLVPARVLSGERVSADSLLYPNVDTYRMLIRTCDGDKFSLDMSNHDLRMALLALVQRTLVDDDIEAVRSEWEFCEPEFVERLIRPSSDDTEAWRTVSGAGIYRREHASLIVSSATTNVLVDPISLASFTFPNMRKSPRNRACPQVDAIAITHGHADHWHLASVLSHADEATRILVPDVPRRTALVPVHFIDELGLAGRVTDAARWGDVIQVGDVEIDVLPFYGEQPTRDVPGAPPDVRNWGNCYRINTPQFSALVLVDSGTDPTGSMHDVVRASVERRGNIDVVLACTRSFPSPFFTGLASDWLTIPFARLQELFVRLKNGTLTGGTAGIEGIVEICAAAGARYFLPYAHGFEGIFTPIRDVGWGGGEPSELEQVKALQAGFNRFGVNTLALPWLVGQAFVRTANGFEILPH